MPSESNELKRQTLWDSVFVGEQMDLNKRRSLFNLYAFPTSNKVLLTLKNISVRNLLTGYQSMVFVERDNIDFQKGLHYGNFNASIEIEMVNSRVSDCDFA